MISAIIPLTPLGFLTPRLRSCDGVPRPPMKMTLLANVSAKLLSNISTEPLGSHTQSFETL